MRFITALFVLSAFFLAACSGNSSREPALSDSVLTEDSMKMLMVDLCITESCIRQAEREGRSPASLSDQYYDLLLQKYHSDTLKIIRSYQFYAARPEALKKITTKVVDSLVIVETMLQKEEN